MSELLWLLFVIILISVVCTPRRPAPPPPPGAAPITIHLHVEGCREPARQYRVTCHRERR